MNEGTRETLFQRTLLKRIKLGCAVALLLITVTILAAILTVGYEIVYAERIYPGVTFAGLDLGGLSQAEAEQALRRHFGDYQKGQLALRYGQRIWLASFGELGANLDPKATAASAWAVGREGSLPDNLEDQIEALCFTRAIAPVLAFDEGTATVYLSRLAREVNRPAQDAALVINDLQVQVTPSQIGREMDVTAARGLVYQRMASEMALEIAPSQDPIDLVVWEITPTITDVSEVQAQVEWMISRPLVLSFTDHIMTPESAPPREFERRWTLDRAAIADMLVLRQVKGEDGEVRWTAGLDQDKLTAYVQDIAQQIDQPARDALFDFDEETGQLTPILTSQEGRTLNITETVRLVNVRVTTEEREIPLAVEVVRPRVALEDADQLGIMELISEGVTHFKGSSRGRLQNIQIATSRFHGIVVPPGEVFSFNKYLGEVSAANGYEDSIIILGDRSAVGIGGGVCQVSTTAFRAAFWGGYPIVERRAHGYRVSWYEPPLGLDATVYSPSTDFKFKNDTAHFILIETETDLKTETLTFRFYGRNPGRTVEMEGPFEENKVPPGPPIYNEDPTLPEGTTKQIDWAHDGVDVTVYRIVKEGNRVLYRDTFFSRYKPWQAVYLVGTRKESGG